jgi:glycosyltransferase involved in cell wall biosynthesis
VRVLVVHNRYRSENPSGEDQVVDNESALLASAGHDVALCLAHSDDIAGMAPWRKALVPGRVVWSVSGRRQVAAAIAEHRPDVVHVHNVFPLLSPAVLDACRDAGVPVVMTVHNYKPMCASGDLQRDGRVCHDCVGKAPLPALQHGCYRGSRIATAPIAVSLVVNRRRWQSAPDAVLALSEAQRTLLVAHGFPADRVSVKANAVDAGPTRPAGSPGDHVVFLGRLSAEKGLDVLLAAWDRLPESTRLSCPLVIGGSGPGAASLARWAAGRPDVTVLGQVPRTVGAEWVGRARAVVMPSVWEETFGLVAIEAMAAGVAPLASAHGSFPSIVTDGVDGLLHRPGDAAHLAEHLALVIGTDDVAIRLGRAGRATYEARYTPAANLAALEGIYRRVSAAAGAAIDERTGVTS